MTITAIRPKFSPANENAVVRSIIGDLSITVEPYYTTVSSVSKPWRRVTISCDGRPGDGSNITAVTAARSRRFRTFKGAMVFARKFVGAAVAS